MSTSPNASTHATHAAPLDAAGQRSTAVGRSAAALDTAARLSAAALLDAVARLSDADLLEQVSALAARERDATTALVAHLAELDARRLYLARGCASLFTYCTEVLRLSEHAAYHRIQAARAARRFPLLLDLLASGALTLTTVTLLAPPPHPGQPPGDPARGRGSVEAGGGGAGGHAPPPAAGAHGPATAAITGADPSAVSGRDTSPSGDDPRGGRPKRPTLQR